MNFGSILYSIIIQPIEVIIEGLFCFYSDNFDFIGMAGCILFVSLAVNFLALPLYNIADKLQERERETQKKLSPWVTHIKKNFKGDEKFMMIQEFYRQNGYHPLYALRSSLSILIEIPFFIAAYNFLSHCSTLHGTAFWFIKDLGNPDHLFSIAIGNFSFKVNVLPILMTLINFISGDIYLKGTSFREKLQLYFLALIFLVLLYDSPSGLVLYWILNNIFSLLKNVFIKYVPNCRKVVYSIILTIFFASGIGFLALDRHHTMIKASVIFTLVIVAAIPLWLVLFKKHFEKNKDSKSNSISLLVFSTLGFALLSGFSLPCGTISSSPLEFSYVGNTASPVNYIYNNIFFYLGVFVFWPICIYKISGEKIRRVMPALFSILFLMALLNAYVFNSNYGNFSNSFKLENSLELMKFSFNLTVLPILVFGLLIILFLVIRKFDLVKYYGFFILVLCISEVAFGITKFGVIYDEFTRYSKTRKENMVLMDEGIEEIDPIYHLSKDKKNVVVLFMDRAMSPYFPYIIQEFPQMEDDLCGFTYYPNTVSYSGNTTKAIDSLLAGYEYTPEELNKRKDISLREKHNEALLVMPRIFHDAGFKVTITDPPLPNYSWKGDFSKYDEYPDFTVMEVQQNYKDRYIQEHPDVVNISQDRIVESNLQSFVLMESMFPIYRDIFYQNGKYFKDNSLFNVEEFLEKYAHLYYLDKLTDNNSDKGAFIFMTNDTTHEFTLLRNHTYEPGALISDEVPSSGSYDYEIGSFAGLESDLEAYHVNAAALLQLSKWVKHLREIGVYDNTRIIVVSDHGRDVPAPCFKGMKNRYDFAKFNPLLLVKDFDSREKLKTDNTFMTNADTIFLAIRDLEVSQINPFTHNRFADFIQKDRVHIYSCAIEPFFRENNQDHLKDKNTWRLDTCSYVVHDNIFDESNWELK